MDRDPRLERIFESTAKSALFSWSQNLENLDDLISDLWVWALLRQSTLQKLKDSEDHLAKSFVRTAALQILAAQALVEDEFRGNNLYSVENVKDALLGFAKNKFLVTIMPAALKALGDKNPAYGEAIRLRYTDGEYPEDKPGKNRLVRAHNALTKHVNIITIEASGAKDTKHTGPKLRNPIDPELRSAGGGHSDPTANTALLLIAHPEMRDDYLELSPITNFTKGPDA